MAVGVYDGGGVAVGAGAKVDVGNGVGEGGGRRVSVGLVALAGPVTVRTTNGERVIAERVVELTAEASSHATKIGASVSRKRMITLFLPMAIQADCDTYLT